MGIENGELVGFMVSTIRPEAFEGAPNLAYLTLLLIQMWG